MKERIKKLLNEIVKKTLDDDRDLKTWFDKSKVTNGYGEPMPAFKANAELYKTTQDSHGLSHYPGAMTHAEKHTIVKYNHTPVHNDKENKDTGYYLKVLNPYHVVDFDGWKGKNFLNSLLYKAIITEDQWDELDKDKNPKEKIIKLLKDKNYDGLVYPDYHESGVMHYNWIVFHHPSQTKKVIPASYGNTIDNDNSDDSGASQSA